MFYFKQSNKCCDLEINRFFSDFYLFKKIFRPKSAKITSQNN